MFLIPVRCCYRVRSLQFRGWQVLTVPQHEWAPIQGSPERCTEYMRQRLGELQRQLKEQEG